MIALNGKPIGNEPVDILMRLFFEGALTEREARDLIILIGTLNLDMKVSTKTSEISIVVSGEKRR